jgi:hypothetical protein
MWENAGQLVGLVENGQRVTEGQQPVIEEQIKVIEEQMQEIREERRDLEWMSLALVRLCGEFLENAVQKEVGVRKREKRECALETIRLKDEEGLSFGQIGRKLRLINRKWRNADGGPISADALKKLYRNWKRRLSNEDRVETLTRTHRALESFHQAIKDYNAKFFLGIDESMPTIAG